jgi:hypothetical protein
MKQSKMRSSGTGSGGGVGSNKITKPSVRYGERTTNKISPGGVGQMGTAIGGMMKGESRHTSQNAAVAIKEGPAKAATKLGNQVAWETEARPGGSRNVYETGTQMRYGAPDPGQAPAKNVDILGAFGPERKLG